MCFDNWIRFVLSDAFKASVHCEGRARVYFDGVLLFDSSTYFTSPPSFFYIPRDYRKISAQCISKEEHTEIDIQLEEPLTGTWKCVQVI